MAILKNDIKILKCLKCYLPGNQKYMIYLRRYYLLRGYYDEDDEVVIDNGYHHEKCIKDLKIKNNSYTVNGLEKGEYVGIW